ncbi:MULTISPECIES: TetR/AcrR family transcriptional regulator [unclassified Isoptericola]|uniref:TetR/AcrR family transcriptional regulator n=1 Tax=unclassified Isoptericola TaxID=2623355 RepID=UPI003664ED57
MTATLPPRRRALDAAVDLLGTEGLRALTHGKVDDRAGLPRGSTSNYFRTRAALLAGVSEELASRDLAGLSAVPEPASAADIVDMLCAGFAQATGPDRAATTARLVLFLEASHDPDLRGRVNRGREALVEWGERMMGRLGAPDARAAMVAVAGAYEGLLLHAIARHDPTDPRPTLTLVVDAALATPR